MPQDKQDALFQLLGYPVKACSNLYDMYYAVAMNKLLAKKKNAQANAWADRVEACFKKDAALAKQYHEMNGGKWNHMMDQVHIGYQSWNAPKVAGMPTYHQQSSIHGEEWLCEHGGRTLYSMHEWQGTMDGDS